MTLPPESRPVARLAWLDLYRTLALLLIFGFHLLYPLYSRLPQSRNVLAVFTESGTMMFTLMAGFLGVFRPEIGSYWRFAGRKFANVFAPYAVATLLILTLRAAKAGNFSFSGVFRDFIFALPDGSAAPTLWFIPMLMLFFLLLPVFRWMLRNIFRWPIPVILLIVPFAVGRGQAEELWRNALYFLPFFLIGMWMARHLGGVTEFFRRFAHPALLTAAMLGLLVYAAIWDGSAQQTAAKIAVGGALLALCFRVRSIPGVLDECARNGMTIYLYHNSLIAAVFVPLFRYTEGFSEAGLIAVWLAGTLIGTFGLSLMTTIAVGILERVGLKSHRWLIGR